MSIRKIKLIGGEYYHIYNRGNSKQKIFQNEKDYQRFISLLYVSNMDENFDLSNLSRNSQFDVYQVKRKINLVDMGAYCLMPNHFHILLTEKTEGGISRFMQKLSTAYSMYYNRKYKRSGSLFEGKFKSQHVDNDNHLKYLFSYIHLNPVKLIQKNWKEKGIHDKNKALKFLKNYNYSSYQYFIGEKRIQDKILDLKPFPEYFPSVESFNKEIFEWLEL